MSNARRDFLRLATGLPLLARNSPAFAPTTTPNNRITVGCIGIGWMGTADLSGFLEESDAQVLAVCDVDAEHLEAGRAAVNQKYQNKDCKAYKDFEELLARDDIDAVVVSTPDHWHGLIGVAAARAGKDIYGEKP